MSEEIVKKEETKPDKTEEELKRIKKFYSDPTASTLEQERDILEEYNGIFNKKERTKERSDKLSDSATKLSMLYALENGLWALNLSYGKYYPMFARIRKGIVEEYNCKAPSELMLADSIVASYWLIMRNQRNISCMIEENDGGYSFNKQKINIINELNKVADSASRRLHASLSLLKELKQPPLKVSVKTNNAFIGQNQQFNDNKNNESK